VHATAIASPIARSPGRVRLDRPERRGSNIGQDAFAEGTGGRVYPAPPLFGVRDRGENHHRREEDGVDDTDGLEGLGGIVEERTNVLFVWSRPSGDREALYEYRIGLPVPGIGDTVVLDLTDEDDEPDFLTARVVDREFGYEREGVSVRCRVEPL
jgi:hypothetical protein